MPTSQQRVVIVCRATVFQQVIDNHGTKQQAKFYLTSRGQSYSRLEARHLQFEESLRIVREAIPADWRRAEVDRADLDRFLFEPSDIIVVLGQDGLVANTAKYLSRQPLIGINPSPQYFEGVLVPHRPQDLADLLDGVANQSWATTERTKVVAELDDGQRLEALNELFVGHQSHQSARYELDSGGRQERQSSSGVIVSTGTGATGWAKSIHRQSGCQLELPQPSERRLVHFTREAWPSSSTGTTLTFGEVLPNQPLHIVSRMEEKGVIFGDGIEQDRLEFNWGQRVSISIAETGLTAC